MIVKYFAGSRRTWLMDTLARAKDFVSNDKPSIFEGHRYRQHWDTVVFFALITTEDDQDKVPYIFCPSFEDKDNKVHLYELTLMELERVYQHMVEPKPSPYGRDAL